MCCITILFFPIPPPVTWQAASTQVKKHLFQTKSALQEPHFYYLSPPEQSHPLKEMQINHSHTSQSQTTLPLTRFHLTLLERRLAQSRCAQLPLHEWVIVHCRKAQGSSSYASQATRSKTSYWKVHKVYHLSCTLHTMRVSLASPVSNKLSEPQSFRTIQCQALLCQQFLISVPT